MQHPKMIRIGGEDFPKEVVKSRLLKLDSGHIEYVISSLRENTTKVRNIRAYLLPLSICRRLERPSRLPLFP